MGSLRDILEFCLPKMTEGQEGYFRVEGSWNQRAEGQAEEETEA